MEFFGMIASNNTGDSFRTLNILEEEVLKTYERELAALAEAAASGEQDVDIKLAQLLEAAPDHIRQAVVAQFHSLSEELKGEKKEQKQAQDLSLEEELALRFEKEKEQRVIAFLLSKRTLEKLRQAFFSNPALFRQVTALGEELSKKGILMDPAQQGRERLGQINADPVKTVTSYQKDKGRER